MDVAIPSIDLCDLLAIMRMRGNMGQGKEVQVQKSTVRLYACGLAPEMALRKEQIFGRRCCLDTV